MPNVNLATVFEGLADALGDRVAVIHGDTRLTLSRLERDAAGLSRSLEERGVGPGDRVAIVSPNCTEMLVVLHAAFKLRAIPVAFNFRFKPQEMLEVLGDSRPAAVFTHAAVRRIITEIRDQAHYVQTWVEFGGAGDEEGDQEFAQMTCAPPAERRIRSDKDLFIQYTGGTTGRPKGVVWSHRDVLNTIGFIAYLPLGMSTPQSVEEMVDIAVSQAESGSSPRYLIPVPLMHGAGLYTVCANLLAGGTTVMLTSPSFDPAEFLAAVERHAITGCVLVGDAFARPIVDALDSGELPPTDLTSLQLVNSSGLAFSAPVKARFMEWFPNALIMEGLAGSEGGPYGTSVTFPGTTPPETAIFTAGPNTVLVDEADSVVPWGTAGHFRLGYRGALPQGYFNDPDKTAATFLIIDGIRTLVPGDYASISADGEIRFIGRGNTCINTGGEKVYPQEIEEAVKLHPGVRDCLIVGVPDDRFGEKVWAIVQPATGVHLDLKAIADHVTSRLAAFKRPRGITVVDEIRRSAAGKADYRWALEVGTAAQHG